MQHKLEIKLFFSNKDFALSCNQILSIEGVLEKFGRTETRG